MMPEQIPDPASERQAASAGPDWLPRWELAALALGDFLALILFAVIGRSSHGMTGPTPLLSVLNTAVPFMVAWLVIGMVLGMYRGVALYPLGRVIWRTLLAGLIAGLLGVVLRAVWLGHPVVTTFLLVGTVSSTLFLLIWRIAWSRLRRSWWPELP
jgi:FlaA1/EpsC-like NDP-sugar epimerase